MHLKRDGLDYFRPYAVSYSERPIEMNRHCISCKDKHSLLRYIDLVSSMVHPASDETHIEIVFLGTATDHSI
jgi:superfamily II helicase